jgi:hypothetical protein
MEIQIYFLPDEKLIMSDYVNLLSGFFMVAGGLFFARYIFRNWGFMIKGKFLRPFYLYASVLTALIAIYLGGLIILREFQKLFP